MIGELFTGEGLSRAEEAEHLLELLRTSPAEGQRDDARHILTLALGALEQAGFATPAIDIGADVLSFDDHFALSVLQARLDAARAEKPVKAAAALAAACGEVLHSADDPDPFAMAVIALRWSRTDLSFRVGGSPAAADARRQQAQAATLRRWGAFALAVAADVRANSPSASKSNIANIIRTRWDHTPREPGEDKLPAKTSDIVSFLSLNGF